MTRNVGIYLFPDVEALDFAGPFEVFTTASRVYRHLAGDASEPFRVFSVARCMEAVRARAGLYILPDYAFDDHPPVDVLIVPGGVVDQQLRDAAVLSWLASVAAGTTVTASVCTGVFMLAQAGVVERGRVTTHWEDLAELATCFPALDVVADVRWVEQGQLVSSAGIAAGIDMCLHVVGQLAGLELAHATARQMDYPWQSGGTASSDQDAAG